MDKLIRKDFWMKVLAVALAILLWVVVMSTYSEPASRLMEIPLRVKLHPIYQVFEGPTRDGERTVEIRAEGTNLVISRLNKNDFYAEVDYSKITELGKPTPVEVKVVGPERGVQAEYHATDPKTITVTLVENRTTTVPLQVTPKSDIVTVNGSDFTITATVAETAQINGRSDFLERVKYGSVTVEPATLRDAISTVTGDHGSLKLPQRVVPIDAKGAQVDKLPVTYSDVDVEWERLPPGRAIKVQPVTRGALAPGFTVGTMVVDPGSVVIRANSLGGKLPDLAVLETFPIDLTGRSRTFTIEVALVLPSGTTANRDTVNVTVPIAESVIEKNFKGVPLSVVGKAENLDTTLTVTDVQVRVKGPYTVVNPMVAGALRAYVDVEGLREGKHVLPVKVTVPMGVSQAVADPSTVDVTLTVH